MTGTLGVTVTGDTTDSWLSIAAANPHPLTLMKSQNPLTQLWQFLVKTHPTITDIQQRRQSRLLSGLMLVLILTSFPASLALIARNNGVVSETVSGLWMAQLITLAFYALNRRGYYRLSSFLFVGFNFAVTFLMPVMTQDPSWLWFTIMVLILSAMLLPEWGTFLLFALGFIAHLVLGNVYPLSATFSNFTTTIVYAVTTPLILVFMDHRVRLERERQAELRAANEALQRSEAELEQRVIERTRDLKVASDVAREITTVLDMDRLLPELVEQTKEGFDLYFVSVYLFKPDTKQLVLAAGTGEAGRQMKTEGRTIHLDTTPSLVAKAARERHHVIINNVSQSTAYLRNPYLLQTQSEAVFPMVVGEELIGVLGLQSRYVDRFQEADVVILATLAEQIAIAVKNAQLYADQVYAAAELRQADQIKTRFLASMSHELRTPLNAILNFNEMIVMGMAGPVTPEQKGMLDHSLSSAQHLLHLINDILDISKIQADRLTLFVEDDINLYQEISQVISMTQNLFQEKPVHLVQDIDEDLPLIAGDRRRIRQILLNLLTNAVKFTEQGTVTLSAKNQGDKILFAITDTGSGIPSDMHEMVFEPFMQTGEGIKQAEGTGLGLPITKSLVEAHGGRIWLESELGEGSAFYVLLPGKPNAGTAFQALQP